MAENKATKKKQREVNAYVAASLPDDELVFAYRYYRWKKSGARGEPPRFPKTPTELFPRKLPTALLLQKFDKRFNPPKSFEEWVKRKIESNALLQNARAVTPPLPGIDESLDRAFAEYEKFCEDLEAARKIAKKVVGKILTDEEKEKLKAKLADETERVKDAYNVGMADGMKQLKPLYDDLKKTERKLAAAKRKSERVQDKVESLEMELEQKNAAISKVRSAREFLKKCRDFARNYCEKTKDDAAEAAQEMMKQDWFIEGIKLHDSKWTPKASSGSAIGHTNEAMIDNIARDIRRWKSPKTPSRKPKTPWKLPFED